MFVHIHIPVVDCRSLCTSFRRLERPVFPFPEGYDFIRNFGGVSFINDPAIPCYICENWFFRGQNALRFFDLPCSGIPIGTQFYNCECKFRRLYSNGKMANRYELGFKFTADMIYIDHLIDYIFGLDVKVKNSNKGFYQTKLINAARYLPEIYEYSTSNQPIHNDGRVGCGEAMCILESGENEEISLTPNTEFILEFSKQKISLHHFVYYQSKTLIHCWIIQKRKSANALFASKLRNALFHIHLESQSLIQAYKFLITTDNQKEFKKYEALLRYITDMQSKLKRRSRFSISTDRIVNTALKASHAIQPSQMTQMIDMVDRIGDKYLTADFLELLSPVSIAEWKEQIETELQKNWQPGTKTQLKYLKEICNAGSFKQFIRFIVQFKGEIWDIAKDVITDRLKKK